MSDLSLLCLKQRQYSSFGLYFVPSSDPGSSEESIDDSLSDYESSDDLSSEDEREEDDLYQPLPFRLVNFPLMKTDTSCTYSRDKIKTLWCNRFKNVREEEMPKTD